MWFKYEQTFHDTGLARCNIMIFYKPGPRIRSQVNDGRFPFCFLQELAIFVNDDLESDLS